MPEDRLCCDICGENDVDLIDCYCGGVFCDECLPVHEANDHPEDAN